MTTSDPKAITERLVASAISNLRYMAMPDQNGTRDPRWEIFSAVADLLGTLTRERDEAREAKRELMQQAIAANSAAVRLQNEARDKALEEAATRALEQRCERGTPWDLACTTIASAIHALKGEA